ncbi:hypothetical protein PPACK8108_LOCUS11249 [Phakopsora pachyrhizi]|uniref:Enoyl reductase (ER) domain-containing protein n=1 Tax=Phakopsora pachyrhizi TaxID=170000 RepID=A0AAV0AZS6_PHAPC|nr:hypothetical protein PPACK8108_LOCUS11249 [Phakopsora pachyrhizi]
MLGWFKRKLGRPSRTYSDGYLTQPRFTQSQDSVFEAAPATSASASLSPVFEPVISPKKNKTIQNPPVKSLEEAPKNYQGLAERECSHYNFSDHGKTFIPGRSFFGKVIGLGKRVKRTKKGDLVYGLQDYSKSGILAEQIKVSEDLVARAPSFIGLNHEKRLTADQVACLPLLAVPAFLITSSVCEGLPKGSKIMILNGHKGVGRLMLRMINNFRSTRDLWVTTHVPASGAGNLVDLDRLCSELQQEGARDVVVSENVVELLESEHECSYDAILDTIGGRSIYDGCRRLLHHHGLFATSVGEPNEGILKPRMRALRRQFFKKGSKHLAYWCVNPLDRFDSTEPQEIRLVLETVTEWIESGYLRGDNIVGDEVTFKKSAQVFIESLDTLLSATNSSDIVEANNFYEDSKMISDVY